MSFSRIARAGLQAACIVIGAFATIHAQAASGNGSARGAASATVTASPSSTSTASPKEATQAAASPDIIVTPDFGGDDPAIIRDILAREHPEGGSHSFTGRIKQFVGTALPRSLRDRALDDGDLGREMAFVLPAPYGIHYRSKTHLMTVDVGVSDGDHPDQIVLKKTVTGLRGRHLVVAAEAKAKGYVQKIDLVELDAAGKHDETTVHGRFALSQDAYTQSNGKLAIVLLCRLVPPYLTETRDHSDPSDDEPTDITTVTSTLHAKVDDIWLINQEKGVVLAKGLRLTK
jgi:hypothetical protein